MPSLLVDLDDPVEVESGIAILTQHRVVQKQQVSAEGDPAAVMIEKLYPRLGKNLKTLLSTVASKPEGSWYTVESLAKELDIAPASLRGKMNAGLRRSWKKVASELADAPELFVWEDMGTHWKFSMTPEVRTAVIARKG